ncbi:hypothetical protein OPT61_g523 [Boeremia exigua]|uniref:Uncharacterized protein n=1 Tax=Boeremia exigua TaxID=749465 RepID=A0ACC2ITH7_9PLEO|nr:hypothetical protein OPT61_g523 [Boeremia exigua]
MLTFATFWRSTHQADVLHGQVANPHADVRRSTALIIIMASTISFGSDNAGFQAHTINGPVHASFHTSPARPETPPQPSIVIPFARDSHFVEQGTTLKDLQTRCTAPDSWTALVGLGGVGKSQLALEHAYRTHKRCPETWVLWVYASNAARFEQSFRKIADSVRIDGRQDPQANIFKLVHDWLRGCKRGWLLVLDNVDDARFLVDCPTATSETTSEPLREYIPHCRRGSVLVTTRNMEAALELVDDRDHIIAVEPMDKVNALALLEKKLEAPSNSSEVAELVAVLEYMPLAIVQAAAYISNHLPRYSVAKYLDEYRKSERKRTSLLTFDKGKLRRDWEAKNSIIVTWQMSFEYIRQTQRSAAELLSLMSFFDRQGIPVHLLRFRDEQEYTNDNSDQQGPTRGAADSDGEDEDDASQSGTSAESEDTFEDDVVTLRNFRFVSDETGGASFRMHALVQLATRTWLAANGELERRKQQFVSNLSAAFPTGSYENWAVCGPLFAHAKAAAEQRPEGELLLREWATLLYRAAWYTRDRGNTAEAEQLALKSLKARQRVLGREHEETWWGMLMLADAYFLGGRWGEAELLQQEVMEKRKARLGAKHSHTLISMASLALTYSRQGRWEDARKLQVDVLEMRKEKLGTNHLHTLISMSNLASTYSNQGRWQDAEKLEAEVLETSKATLGAEHPGTLVSMASLASNYRDQGRWEDAEKLQVQVLETSKTKLGADHPHTLVSIANLAALYSNQGRWEDAEKLQVELLETSKTKLGADHPDTLTNKGNIASTYSNQGRWQDAEKLMANLALAYSNQGLWEDAERLEVEVLEMRKTKLGAHHPDTLTSMNNLASTYYNQGQLQDAEKLFVEVLETSKTKLGAGHPSTLVRIANLAALYSNQGRWEDAEKLQVEMLETCKAKLGADHPHTLTSMANLSATYSKQGWLEAAEKLDVEVLEMRKAKLGADHPDTLTSMENLAFTYYKQGRWRDAEKLDGKPFGRSEVKRVTAQPIAVDTIAQSGQVQWSPPDQDHAGWPHGSQFCVGRDTRARGCYGGKCRHNEPS